MATLPSRCWAALGGVGDFELLLRSSSILQSACSSIALEALIEFALPPHSSPQPVAASSLLRLLPDLPSAAGVWRLLQALRSTAERSEATAVSLSRGGLCRAALELALEIEWPDIPQECSLAKFCYLALHWVLLAAVRAEVSAELG